jgi:hypothetical protein
MEGLVVEPSSATGLTYAADGTNSYINFEANSISDSVQLYAGQSSGGYFSIGTKNSGGTLAERMRIESSGTVKISHADTASEGFRVIQTTAARTSGGALGLFYDDQAGTTQPTLAVQQNGTGDILQLFDGGSQVVTVKDGGSVGIGTSSPSYPFHLSSSGDTVAAVTAGASSIAALNLGNSTNLADGGIRYDNSANALILRASNAERMRIDSSGNLVKVGGVIKGERGTASAPAYSFSDDTDTGMFNIANADLGFAVGGSERMRIDSSGNLLVGTTDTTPGIGDTNAGISMSAANGIIISRANDAPINMSRNSSDGDLILFRKDGATVGRIGVEGSDLTIGTGDTGLQFRDASDAIRPFNISTNAARDANIDLGRSSERFRDLYLSGTGYFGTSVGIGTSSPATTAHIYDASTDAVLYIDSANANGSHARFLASGSVKHFVGSGGGFGLGDVDDFAIRSFDNLIFATNNSSTERMRIDSSGNVGIGTSLPAYKTQISDSGDTVLSVTSGDSNSASLYLGDSVATRGRLTYNNANDSLAVYTDNNERIRIDSSGSLLVGTASALLNNRSLQVKANGGNDAAVIQSTAVTAKTLLCWNNVTSGDNQFIGFLTEAGGTQRGLIDYNRASGQVRYNVTSDARLKNNIKNAEESGSLIDSIQVRQYDLKETNHHVGFGFIAQELQTVAPEAVSGDADSEEMMGVDYSKLVPMLIKEIQSLRNRVAQLEE